MSLGVLTNTAAIYAENNLNQTQSSLQNTLTQLSSGSRINSGSDDAAGLSVVDGLQANVSALTQSSQNASDGIGLLQTADGALSQVTNLLNRAVTLATESANGTLNTNQVSSANAEYQNILTEIGNIGNTTNFNGNSVFTASAKTVFVSDGTASGANSFSETVGALTSATVGITASTSAAQNAVAASAISGSAANGGTGTPNFVSTGGGAGAVGVATLSAGAASDTFSAGSYAITYGSQSATVNINANESLSNVQTAFAAATASLTGLTTSAVSGSGFTVTGATNAVPVTITNQGVKDQNAASGTAQSTSIQLNSANDYVTGSISLQTGTGAATVLTPASATTTGTEFAAAINANTSTTGYSAAFGTTPATENTLTITGKTGAGNDLGATSSLVDNTTATAQASGVNFSNATISTLSASSAATVLTSVTTAIGDVAYQRGLIGADVNELTAASNVASAESVNLTSAQSSIQSTDYGAATSNLAKFQVLSQTGISALAQANSVQQEVLKLLQ